MSSRVLRGGFEPFRGAEVRPVALGLVVVLTAAVCGSALAQGFHSAGPLVALVPLGIAAFALLLLQPKLVLALLVVATVALEDDPEAFISAADSFHSAIPESPLEPTDVLMINLVLGTLIRLARRRASPRPLMYLTVPMLVLAAAIAVGVVGGYFGEADTGALLNSVRKLAFLLVTPWIAAQLLETRRDLQVALALGLALVLYKSAEGLAGYLLGIGRDIGGTVLTFYSPAANFLLLVFGVIMLAAALTRTRMPVLAWLATPFATAVLILSFRRSFYLAMLVGVVLVVLFVTGQKGRALLLPAAATLLAALALGFTALGDSQSNSALVERVQSLAPGRLEAGVYGRYRLDEQRNVRAEIVDRPLTGKGLGVPWDARYPLAVSFIGGQEYVHASVLWYWLKLGILGLIAYLLLMAASVRLALRLWRHATDQVIRVVGLGMAIGFIGLMVAETTGAFVGVESRVTIMFGTAIGWLVVANRLYQRDSPLEP